MSCGFVSADDQMAGRVGGVEILRLIGKQKPESYHVEEITSKGRTWRGLIRCVDAWDVSGRKREACEMWVFLAWTCTFESSGQELHGGTMTARRESRRTAEMKLLKHSCSFIKWPKLSRAAVQVECPIASF